MGRRIWVAGLVIALASSAGWAQSIRSASAYGFYEDDKEFIINGGGVASDDFDSNTFSLNAQHGWFLSDNIVAGGRLGMAFADSPGGDSTSQFSIAGYADYHFDLDRWQPFVGAQLGWVGGDDIADSIFIGPEGGVKYFLNDTTFLVGQIAYQYFFDDEDDITFDNGRWAYSIGMGLRY